ncbi:MAG: hypothetical protein VYE56_04010 [Pseudomonadota bacterium]|nr:hypothetical protein [Pseudomonadota bacterium]
MKEKLWLLFLIAFSFNAYAQDVPPPNSLYVATQCFVNDGATFAEVVEEARSADISGPNSVFFRQPVAGNDAAPNQFTRVVVWDNMEHWATNVLIVPTESYTCDNANRSFWTNRVLGTNQNAYDGTDVSLVTTRLCFIERGHTIADVYKSLNDGALAREAMGDTTMSMVSHLFLGPSTGTDMRTRIIGDSEAGLARSLDMLNEGDVGIGTPVNVPAEHCQDATLTRSYIIRRNN